MGRVAVHGFGRIGRSAVKGAVRDHLSAPAVITDVKDSVVLGALFEFDTNYGRSPAAVTADAESITIGSERASSVNVSDGLPDWAALSVDVVVDCSGRATVREVAETHLERGGEACPRQRAQPVASGL
jgi:glyceraldehyde 3-phosphate dehydrogenase